MNITNGTNSSSGGGCISEDCQQFEFILVGILTTFIAVLGIAGNILTLIVLSRRQMRSSINCYLLSLASFDMVVLISAMFLFCLTSLSKNYETFSFYLRYVFPQIAPYIYPLGLIAQTGSVWTTVTVTFERYVAVCHPLKAKFVCTYNRAKMFNIGVTVLAIIYNIPRFFEANLEEVTDPKTNVTFYQVQPSDFRQNQTYHNFYHVWLYMTVMYFIPFSILFCLNLRIYITVRVASRERELLNQRRHKEIKLAVMLLFVVIVFFMCNVVAMIVNFLEHYNYEITKAVQVGNFLVALNSSVNVVIYYIFGQKFRKVLFQLMCYCLVKRRGMNLTDHRDMENHTSAVNIDSKSRVNTKINSSCRRETKYL